MQSDSNIIYDNDNNNLNKIDNNELLLKNKEILNTLVLENSQRKDKSFISIKELEIIKEYESNLMKLLENCPPKILKGLATETNLDDE